MALTRSRPKVGVGYLGPYPEELWSVLAQAWQGGFSIASNYARDHAPVVALAASLGWISTVSLCGRKYGRTWHITAEGVSAFNSREQVNG